MQAAHVLMAFIFLAFIITSAIGVIRGRVNLGRRFAISSRGQAAVILICSIVFFLQQLTYLDWETVDSSTSLSVAKKGVRVEAGALSTDEQNNTRKSEVDAGSKDFTAELMHVSIGAARSKVLLLLNSLRQKDGSIIEDFKKGGNLVFVQTEFVTGAFLFHDGVLCHKLLLFIDPKGDLLQACLSTMKDYQVREWGGQTYYFKEFGGGPRPQTWILYDKWNVASSSQWLSIESGFDDTIGKGW